MCLLRLISNKATLTFYALFIFTFTFSHLADALIQSDLQYRDILPEARRVKCLAQRHNVILHAHESNQQPSD